MQRHLLDVYGTGPYGSGLGTEASSGLPGMLLAVTVAMNWFWRTYPGPTVCLSLLSSRVFEDELCLGERIPGTSIGIVVFKPWWSGDISLEPEKQQSEVASSYSLFSPTSITPMANFSVDYPERLTVFMVLIQQILVNNILYHTVGTAHVSVEQGMLIARRERADLHSPHLYED